MSFSMKWLFAMVAIGAVFAAGFVFQNIYWTIATVSLTLVILSSAVVALAIRLADKSFWLPFCIAGWIYLFIAFYGYTRLPAYLPPTRLAFEAWMRTNEDMVQEKREELNPLSLYHAMSGGGRYDIDDYQEPYYNLLDTVQSFSALMIATFAGVIASYCVRRSKTATGQGPP